MIQVSFVGYWVGGSFLGLAYWDMPYVLLSVLVLTRVVVDKQLGLPVSSAAPSGAGLPALETGPSGQGKNA